MNAIPFIILFILLLVLSYKRCKYIMYGRESCPHCVVMKKQLKNDAVFHDFRYIEVTSDYGKKAFANTGADSVPHFVNQETGKTVAGSTSTPELLKNLNEKHTFDDVVVFGSLSCGYTVKLIDALKQNKVWDKVTFVDTDTTEGKREYNTLGVDGVPFTVHAKNGKSAHGYMDIEALKEKLNIQ